MGGAQPAQGGAKMLRRGSGNAPSKAETSLLFILNHMKPVSRVGVAMRGHLFRIVSQEATNFSSAPRVEPESTNTTNHSTEGAGAGASSVESSILISAGGRALPLAWFVHRISAFLSNTLAHKKADIR